MAWRDLYAYWRDCRVDGRPPTRADIDPPIEIPHLVPNLMIIDIEEGGFRVRLAGSELTRRAGYDGTGNRLDPVRMPERGAQTFVELVAKVAATGAPVLYSVSRSQQSAAGAIALLLPLFDQAGQTHKILGGVFYEPGSRPDTANDWDPGAVTELDLAQNLARTDLARYGR
jgi:hypothetical protein